MADESHRRGPGLTSLFSGCKSKAETQWKARALLQQPLQEHQRLEWNAELGHQYRANDPSDPSDPPEMIWVQEGASRFHRTTSAFPELPSGGKHPPQTSDTASSGIRLPGLPLQSHRKLHRPSTGHQLEATAAQLSPMGIDPSQLEAVNASMRSSPRWRSAFQPFRAVASTRPQVPWPAQGSQVHTTNWLSVGWWVKKCPWSLLSLIVNVPSYAHTSMNRIAQRISGH